MKINLITFEQSGFQNLVNNYIVLENHDIYKLSLNENKVVFENLNENINYEVKNINKISNLI